MCIRDSATTLRELYAAHEASGAAVTVLTAQVPNPTGYGRIVRGADGGVERIVEHRDASAAELTITAVSYTHLDVYKRQVENHGVGAAGGRIREVPTRAHRRDLGGSDGGEIRR